MAGRPIQKKANIEALQLLALSTDTIVDIRPVIAYVMKSCGATSREVGEVFGISRQMADILIDQVKDVIR